MADAKLEIVLSAKDASEAAFRQVSARVKEMSSAVFSLRGALAGLGVSIGIGALAKSVLDTASSFEQLTIKLDTVTKGKGQETLRLIDETVKDLPVDVAKATDAWVMMGAMGLTPTADKLRTLIDVSSVLGEETMPRVARALGQMASLGKVSAEELNQLSEVGINARKYLAEGFGMTVEQLQKSNVSIQQVIDTIWRGLDADYAGGAQKAMNSWKGLTIEFQKNWQSIERQIADAGVFELVKEGLRYVNKEMKTWIDNNQNFIKQDFPAYVKNLAAVIKSMADALVSANNLINRMIDQAYGIDRRSYEQKLTSELAANEKVLATFERSNMPGREAWIEQLRTEIQLQKDKLAILRSQASANKQQTAAAERYVTGGEIGDYARSAPGSAAGKGKEAKSIWEGWGVRPYTESEAFLADQKAFEEWKKLWASYEQRLPESQQSEAMLADQARWEEWKKSAENTFSSMIELSERTAEAMQENFSDLFFDAMTGELSSFEDYATAVLRSIQRALADVAAQMATQAIFGAKSVGGTGGGGGLISYLSDLLAVSSTASSAYGNVFTRSGVERFASGGVVSRPTVFPFANGVGLMGEAGPEAVMPLRRMPSGRLGVEASAQQPNITINVAAPSGRVDRESLSQMQAALFATLSRSARRNA